MLEAAKRHHLMIQSVKKSHSLIPDSQVHLPGNSTQVAMHCTTTQAAGIHESVKECGILF